MKKGKNEGSRKAMKSMVAALALFACTSVCLGVRDEYGNLIPEKDNTPNIPTTEGLPQERQQQLRQMFRQLNPQQLQELRENCRQLGPQQLERQQEQLQELQQLLEEEQKKEEQKKKEQEEKERWKRTMKEQRDQAQEQARVQAMEMKQKQEWELQEWKREEPKRQEEEQRKREHEQQQPAAAAREREAAAALQQQEQQEREQVEKERGLWRSMPEEMLERKYVRALYDRQEKRHEERVGRRHNLRNCTCPSRFPFSKRHLFVGIRLYGCAYQTVDQAVDQAAEQVEQLKKKSPMYRQELERMEREEMERLKQEHEQDWAKGFRWCGYEMLHDDIFIK
jgi:hypothetical protein